MTKWQCVTTHRIKHSFPAILLSMKVLGKQDVNILNGFVPEWHESCSWMGNRFLLCLFVKTGMSKDLSHKEIDDAWKDALREV